MPGIGIVGIGILNQTNHRTANSKGSTIGNDTSREISFREWIHRHGIAECILATPFAARNQTNGVEAINYSSSVKESSALISVGISS